MRRRSHGQKKTHPQNAKTLAHIRLKLRRLMFPPPVQCKKDDQSEETDGIVSYHGDCSWPQLMMVNNPNECYTMFAIAISLSARGLAEKMIIVMLISQTEKEMSNITCLSHVKLMCLAYSSPFPLILCPPPFAFCLSFSSLFFFSFFLAILKGSLSKSNTVSLSVRQLQSPGSVVRPVDPLTHLPVV